MPSVFNIEMKGLMDLNAPTCPERWVTPAEEADSVRPKLTESGASPRSNAMDKQDVQQTQPSNGCKGRGRHAYMTQIRLVFVMPLIVGVKVKGANNGSQRCGDEKEPCVPPLLRRLSAEESLKACAYWKAQARSFWRIFSRTQYHFV